MPLVECTSRLYPGSYAARQQGCTCDPRRNREGRGIGYPPLYELAEDCLVHRPVGERVEREPGEWPAVPSIEGVPRPTLRVLSRAIVDAVDHEDDDADLPELPREEFDENGDPICPRCDTAIRRVPGRRGRPPKIHDECLTDVELRSRRRRAAKVRSR